MTRQWGAGSEIQQLACRFPQQFLCIEWAGVHSQMTILGKRPFGFGTIPRQLYAILVGITEIKCLADPVVARAFKANARIDQSSQCIGQRRSRE